MPFQDGLHASGVVADLLGLGSEVAYVYLLPQLVQAHLLISPYGHKLQKANTKLKNIICDHWLIKIGYEDYGRDLTDAQNLRNKHKDFVNLGSNRPIFIITLSVPSISRLCSWCVSSKASAPGTSLAKSSARMVVIMFTNDPADELEEVRQEVMDEMI